MKLNKDLQVKIQKFKSDKRAHYSMLALMLVFFLTLPTEFLCNVRPILLVVDGKPYFPIVVTYNEQDFGGPLISEPDYKSQRFLRILKGESPDAASMVDLNDFDETVPGSSYAAKTGVCQPVATEELAWMRPDFRLPASASTDVGPPPTSARGHTDTSFTQALSL